MAELKTLVNFRDLGGYNTGDGRVLQPKRLLRSGEVVGLSNQDANILTTNFKLEHIIDLRSAEEISEKPDDSLENVAYTHIDIMKKEDNVASEKGMLHYLNPDASIARMHDLYKDMVIDNYAIKGYQEFVNLLIENNQGAILFHCFAGKDRTGMGAAILLGILGVSQQDIMQDYLKTNAQRVAANQLILAKAKEKGLNNSQLEGLNNLMSVKQDYLEFAWRTIDQEFGSFQEYILNGLKVSPSDQDALKHNYLD